VSAPAAAASLLFLMFVAAGCDSSKKATTTSPSEALAAEGLDAVPSWKVPAAAVAGARLFVLSGCTTCHTYRGTGSRQLGAKDLTRVGLRHDRGYFERYVRRPGAFGNDVMPPFSALGKTRLRQLAIFLAASRGKG
jgi:mono/diheme cytochrome c family protein